MLQDSTDDDELKRSFPVKPPSDRYKFAKNTDDENEVYDYTEEYTAPKVKDKPFERDVWRRMGQAIDRQFLALGGGVQVSTLRNKYKCTSTILRFLKYPTEKRILILLGITCWSNICRTSCSTRCYIDSCWNKFLQQCQPGECFS